MRIGIHSEQHEHGEQANVYRETWGKDWLQAAAKLAAKAAAINVLYGTPAQIAESIRAFPAFGLTTELQFSGAYGTTDRGQRLAAIAAIAGEIATLLGRKPEGES